MRAQRVHTPILPAIVAALAWCTSAGSAPRQLITSNGELIASVADEAASAAGAAAGLSVVASVGGKTGGRKLLNALFGTEFSTGLPLSGVADTAGAWLATSTSAPGLVLMDTEAAAADASSEEDPSASNGANECALSCFSLAVADAVIVHSPCVKPTASLVRATLERLFVEHLSTLPPPAEAGENPARTMLVYVQNVGADAVKQLSLARSAIEDAWSAASSSTAFAGTTLASLFEFVPVMLPSAKSKPKEHEAAVAELRTKLRSLNADGFRKIGKPADLVTAATDAWSMVQSVSGGKPAFDKLRDRYVITRAFEASYEGASSEFKSIAGQVASSKVVPGFGSMASGVLNSSLETYDEAVADCSAGSADLISKQRDRLQKALYSDVRELFSKQHRSLTVNTFNAYKAQLLKVMSRAGSVQQWQRERLRRNAEKAFDAQLTSLMVPEIGGPSRAELTDGFGRALTSMATKFIDSPAMQLQAIGAMRRRTSKGQKPPRGLRWGLGLTGAIRNKWGGGQGNFQSFVGFVDGLNSAHLMFANDGAISDSTGSEPPALRFQPKLNFDVSI